jgi:hypothetical protein
MPYHPHATPRPRGRLTAHAPLHKLVDETSRLGWGDLAGREWGAVRALYRAFVSADGIHALSAQGKATVPELARHAGITVRWATDRLGVMEAAGLLEQVVEGGFTPAGVPQPSFWRVNKQALVDMLEAARELRDEAVRAAWVAMKARMAKLHSLRALYLKRCHERREKRLPRSLPHEVTARPSPLSGRVSTSPPPGGGVDRLQLPPECEHGGILGRCPSCRRLNGSRSAAAQTM